MLPKWFVPLTVTVIAGFSIWMLSSEAPKQPRLINMDKSVPDAFMENFTAHNFDNKGIPRHEISAEYMAHYPVDDYSEFTSPELILFKSGKQRWSVSAEKGTTTKDIKEIILHGEVNINRLNKLTGKPDLVINTAEILIRPDENYLETDKKISMTTAKHKLESIGIRANLDEGKVELLSRVRGIYAL